MLQVKLWNKQIPSYTHRDTNQTHKQVLHTSSHPPSRPQCLWGNVFELLLHCILLLLPLQLESSLGTCINQCTAYTSTLSADTNASAHAIYMQSAGAGAQCGSELSVEGHLVTPAMPCSLWSAVSVASVVSCGDGRLAAQHFQPRQPTSEKEIWVVQMEGLLLSYLQNPVLVQRHPPYSIWERVRVVPAVLCARELGGFSMGVDVNAGAFTRKGRLLMCICRCWALTSKITAKSVPSIWKTYSKYGHKWNISPIINTDFFLMQICFWVWKVHILL